MEQTDYTKTLSRFVCETNYEHLPNEVVDTTKRVILDTLGCCVGGFLTERQKVLIDLAKELSGRPESTILVTGDKVPCTTAAMVNAEAANALEGEETFLNLAHFGPVIVASALSVGERTFANGRDMITAVALGYDVNARIELAKVSFRAVDGQLQSSSSGGLGSYTIGAAVAASKMLGLDETQTAHAIGIAGALSPSPSTMKLNTLPRLTMLKYGAMFAPAYTGIMAALLAQKGYIGDPTILDGEAGFFHFQGALETDWDILVSGLGEKWWILEAAYRIYPSCRYISAPLDLFYQIKAKHGIQPTEIERVVIGINPIGLGVPCEASPWMEPDPHDPCTQLDSIFNAPYLISLAALGYKPGPDWYALDRFADPIVRELMKRIEIGLDEAALNEVMRALSDEPTHRFRKSPASITIYAKGQVFDARAEYAHGDPWLAETKISDDELVEKFRTYTRGCVRCSKIERAIDVLLELEMLDTVPNLAQLLTL